MATVPAENLPAVQTGPMTPQRERYMMLKDQAKMFANSPLIPEHLRKGSFEQTAANCLIAIQMAERMGEMPLVVMQNIHIINGKAGFASQYMIARANASGVFAGRVNWRIAGEGEALEVTAYATLKETGEEVAFTASMRMAKAEGWTSNKKYQTMPEVMLRYRSAAFLIRFYAPDVMLGHQTTEEIEDVRAATIDVPRLTTAALLEQAQPDAAGIPEGEWREGRSDEQHGDQNDGISPAEADILTHIARKVAITDVNSLVSSRLPELDGDEEAQQRVRDRANDRIAELRANPQ